MLRPASLVAAYPYSWQRVRDREMHWHRTQRRHLRGCCLICRQHESELPRGTLQVMHLGWQPDDLRREFLTVGCSRCHRGWDQGAQDAAATLTRAGEGTLDYSTYSQRLADLREQVAAHGLIMLAPSQVDLSLAACLQAGPAQLDELANRLRSMFPEVHDALSGCLEASIDAALWRLSQRAEDVTGIPYVIRTFDRVTLTLGRLHLDPGIEQAPHSRWTAQSYVRHRAS
ncbi:hypothetical protein ACFSR9_05870 [Deinococcus taklimakanensis]|uniref:HNH endonuclease n=1 Tax=Deinococcus taklimakanensis TaxID=536443 RepID=A0ABW5P185_9DEIO